MSALQILVPMGGLGQRFRDQGYDTPKPLIPVDGRAMVLRALDSYSNVPFDLSYIFVVRRDAQEMYGLGDSIMQIIPKAKIVYLESDTRGAAESCLLARGLLDESIPLVVMDCDFSFRSPDYFETFNAMIRSQDSAGLLLGFRSQLPRYSYARVGSDGYVLETAEKLVISDTALAGAYGFLSAGHFTRYAERLLTRPLGPERKEYYLSMVYSEMLASGERVRLAMVSRFDSFGTPEELEAYLSRSKNGGHD